jgi:hypothetical protein
VDRLAGSLGNPQSLNRYSYAGNDPVNFNDPSGLLSEESLRSMQYLGILPYDLNPADLWGLGSANSFTSYLQHMYGYGENEFSNWSSWPFWNEFPSDGSSDGRSGPASGPTSGWGQARNACHERNLKYLYDAGILSSANPVALEYGDNGGIRWKLTPAQAKSLRQRLTSANGSWASSTWAGTLHKSDVGVPLTDHRSITRDGNRSVQIVIGPETGGTLFTPGYVYVYADTDKYNPLQDVVSVVGHFFGEVIPGAVGHNVSCKGT